MNEGLSDSSFREYGPMRREGLLSWLNTAEPLYLLIDSFRVRFVLHLKKKKSFFLLLFLMGWPDYASWSLLCDCVTAFVL